MKWAGRTLVFWQTTKHRNHPRHSPWILQKSGCLLSPPRFIWLDGLPSPLQQTNRPQVCFAQETSLLASQGEPTILVTSAKFVAENKQLVTKTQSGVEGFEVSENAESGDAFETHRIRSSPCPFSLLLSLTPSSFFSLLAHFSFHYRIIRTKRRNGACTAWSWPCRHRNDWASNSRSFLPLLSSHTMLPFCTSLCFEMIYLEKWFILRHALKALVLILIETLYIFCWPQCSRLWCSTCYRSLFPSSSTPLSSNLQTFW